MRKRIAGSDQVKRLDPRFLGALDDATALASTFADAGVVLWICDRGAPISGFAARTYTGNLQSEHALAAIDAIVNIFRRQVADPKVARAFDEITAAIRESGADMSSSGSSPIQPRATN